MTGDARDARLHIDAGQRIAALVAVDTKNGGDILAELALRIARSLHYRAGMAPGVLIKRQCTQPQAQTVEAIAVVTGADIRDRRHIIFLFRPGAACKCDTADSDCKSRRHSAMAHTAILSHFVPQVLRMPSNSDI